MEGKVIVSFVVSDCGMYVTIGYADGTSTIITARGRDSWLTVENIDPWASRKW